MRAQPPNSPAMLALAATVALLLAMALACLTSARAQTSPAFGPLAEAPAPASTPASSPGRSGLNSPASLAPLRAVPAESDTFAMADYLALLRQIAPAAELGARDYLAAFRLRCGRAMTSAQLRQAFASEPGDPILMGLIRASQRQDMAMRQALLSRVPCPAGAAR